MPQTIAHTSLRISILVQKHSTFPYVSYIEECCQSLHDANEFPYDKHMIHLIHLQHLAEKIDRLSASHGSDLMKPGSGSELYVTNLKADLEGFYRRLPFDMYEMRECISPPGTFNVGLANGFPK